MNYLPETMKKEIASVEYLRYRISPLQLIYQHNGVYIAYRISYATEYMGYNWK